MVGRKANPLRILVAIDGSRGGTAALRFAARIAAGDPSAALTVVTIGTEPGPGDSQPPRAVAALRAAASLLRRLKVPARIEIAAPVFQETIPETIARESDRRNADLVVVGSEGRDTLREWVVGGTALRLIYLARRPVAVVRPTTRRRAR